MKQLTVFTPTYNRAYCLDQLYQSLVSQTNQDFVWMIIDDGSSDGTQDLVQKWKDENKIEIEYLFKKNGGMHTAHNTAYKNITTKFNVCIDSDDFMPNNAVELILKNTQNLDENCAGIIGLDEDISGNLIGSKIPEFLTTCKLSELHQKYKVTGDKKLVYKTEVVKKYEAYPVFEDEKFVPLGYLYYQIDQDYFLIPLNEVLVIVNYQEDGSTKNMLRQYIKNPKGFAHSRIKRMQISKDFKDNIKNAIHLISCILLSKDVTIFKKSNHKLLLITMFPLGMLLYFYILFKTKN